MKPKFDLYEYNQGASSVNQCPTCGELFRSDSAFDMHRVGEFSKMNADKITYTKSNRRCLTEQEMLDKGMVKNPKGFWVTEQFSGEQIEILRNKVPKP